MTVVLTADTEVDNESLGAKIVELQGQFTGVTPGTVAASKAIVADANKDVTAGLRNLSATGNLSGGYKRQVVADGAAVVLTAAQSGALCIFKTTTGALFTLPAPSVGLWFDFMVETVVSSGSAKVITDAGTTFIKGTALEVTATGPTVTLQAANGTTHISVTMNGTTTGGIAGTAFRLTCTSATIWEISSAIIVASGAVATPFANT